MKKKQLYKELGASKRKDYRWAFLIDFLPYFEFGILFSRFSLHFFLPYMVIRVGWLSRYAIEEADIKLEMWKGFGNEKK